MQNLINQIGGPVVALLLLLSLIASAVIFYRLILMAIQRERSPDADTLMVQLRHSTPDLQSLAGTHAPRLQVIRKTCETLQSPQLTAEQMRSEVYRMVRNQVQQLGTGLRTLEVIATVAPLLGLFGTVLGMIEAFRAMEAAGAQVDPSALSGGIWQALLTTAVGLGVAIPVSLIHSFFERRNENLSVSLLSDAEELLNRSVLKDAGSENQRLKAVGQ